MNILEVKTSKLIIAKVGDYTVFQDKVWKVISTKIKRSKTVFELERAKTEEKICTFYPKLFKIIYPTNYIDI